MNLFSWLRFPGQVVGTVIDTVLTARAVARHGELFAAWAEPAREGLVEFEAEHEVLPGGFSWGDVAGTYREALSHYCNRCGGAYVGDHKCLRNEAGEYVPRCTDACSEMHRFEPGCILYTSSASPPGADANPEEVEPPSRQSAAAPSFGVDPSGTNASVDDAVPGEGPSDSAIPPAPEGHPTSEDLHLAAQVVLNYASGIGVQATYDRLVALADRLTASAAPK